MGLLMVSAAAWIFTVAAIVAAILNLHVDGGIRFLLLAVAVLAYGALKQLSYLQKELERVRYWTRLGFIAAHIRNEADGLTPAMDRLHADVEIENDRVEFGNQLSRDANWIYPAFGVLFLIALGAMLNFQLFGDFGAHWFSIAFPAFPNHA
jgi:hypothetical protein